MGAPLTATDDDLQRLARHRMVVRQCARRYRARKRNGARCLRIEISNAEQTLDAFVKIGVLAEERRNDDRAIEAAISVLCKRGYSAVKAERETDRDDNCAGNAVAT
jgi:predicted GNAT superfamily acetyltransferase